MSCSFCRITLSSVIILDEYQYTAEMMAAIAQAYPRIELLGPYTIRRPTASPSADEGHP